jgi:hypothetical protein
MLIIYTYFRFFSSSFFLSSNLFEKKDEDIPPIHTKLTTIDAIKKARFLQSNMTIFIKVVPGGYSRKFVCDSNDTMFYLHHMFFAHSHLGNSISPKLLLPSILTFI